MIDSCNSQNQLFLPYLKTSLNKNMYLYLKWYLNLNTNKTVASTTHNFFSLFQNNLICVGIPRLKYFPSHIFSKNTIAIVLSFVKTPRSILFKIVTFWIYEAEMVDICNIGRKNNIIRIVSNFSCIFKGGRYRLERGFDRGHYSRG